MIPLWISSLRIWKLESLEFHQFLAYILTICNETSVGIHRRIVKLQLSYFKYQRTEQPFNFTVEIMIPWKFDR